jgi:hypothetical protein
MRLQESAVLARFSAGMPGEARQDKRLTDEVKTDKGLGKDAGRWVKRLYPAEALEAIRTIVGEARTKHYELTLPWDNSGRRILPTTTYLEYQTFMRDLHKKFDAAREVFNANWSKWVEWAKIEHNGSFNSANYDQHKAYRMFKFCIDFEPVPEDGDFRVALQADDVATMKTELNERMKEALEAAQKDLWERLATPIRAMVDRLGNPDAIFRDSLVENLQNIVDLTPKLNIAGDTTLNDFAKECSDKLLKFNTTTLRDSPAVRSATAKDAEELLNRMKDYLPKAD